MASGSIGKAFSEKGAGPYGKPIKCKVLAVDEPCSYRGKDGTSRKAMTVAVSDGLDVVKMIAYDEAKFKYLKVGQTISARETIRRTEEEGRVLVLTSVTKVYISGNLEVPADHEARASGIINPPPAEQVSMKEALRSPPKKKVSVTGRIVQEDEPRTVNVKGEDVRIKNVILDDGTDMAKVTLWRGIGEEDTRPGNFVVITNVISNVYNNKTTLSTTPKSKIRKCAAPEERKVVQVEGVSVTDGKAELLLDNDSTMCMAAELLQTAFVDVKDIECITCHGPVMLKVITKGGDVISCEKL